MLAEVACLQGARTELACTVPSTKQADTAINEGPPSHQFLHQVHFLFVPCPQVSAVGTGSVSLSGGGGLTIGGALTVDTGGLTVSGAVSSTAAYTATGNIVSTVGGSLTVSPTSTTTVRGVDRCWRTVFCCSANTSL